MNTFTDFGSKSCTNLMIAPIKKCLQENKEMEAELEKLREELAMLGVAAKEGAEAASRVKFLEAEVKQLIEENRVLTENYNSERVSTILQ